MYIASMRSSFVASALLLSVNTQLLDLSVPLNTIFCPSEPVHTGTASVFAHNYLSSCSNIYLTQKMFFQVLYALRQPRKY